MGMSHAAYLVYGVHVPAEKFTEGHLYSETDKLDSLINETPGMDAAGVGHLTAGNYDRDHLFLAVTPEDWDAEVELGTFRVIRADTFAEHRLLWDEHLDHLAALAGYEGLERPGWIVVPDES